MKPMVLIADSDAELRDVYRRAFTGRGYEVETAADGLDCLARLRRRTPAAVVLDLDLPWGGGNGVVAWLREERPTSDVAVILTATAGRPVDASEAMEPPVIGVLLKPFTLPALLNSVHSALAEGQKPARKAGQTPALSEFSVGR
jgi:two-component system response regulator MprA